MIRGFQHFITTSEEAVKQKGFYPSALLWSLCFAGTERGRLILCAMRV